MKTLYSQRRSARQHPQTGAMSPIAITFIMLILLAGGGAYYYFVMLNDDTREQDKTAKEQAQGGLPPIYLDLDPAFIVNFEHKGTLRYLQANLSVMARDQTIIDKVTLHMPAIRDSVLTLLSNKTYSELSGKAHKEKLRLEMLLEIRKIIGTSNTGHSVENVYITGYVMQ